MPSFTDEDKKLAEKIMIFSRREAVKKITYLEKAIYYLSLKVSDKVKFMGADYSTLFYNPVDVIETYKKNPVMVEKAIVHCVLHCMLLHPSTQKGDEKFFNVVSDAIINVMLENFYDSSKRTYTELLKKHKTGAGYRLFGKAMSDQLLYKKLLALWTRDKTDDHRIWHNSCDETEGNVGGNGNAKESDDDGKHEIYGSGEVFADKLSECKSDWQSMFENALSLSRMQYGNQSGNIFANLNPPDRFSRFSYLEYLKRFIAEEIPEDDPETFDMLLYTAGLEIYEDMPIVELNEIRETVNPSDIIIAIDMSGSCGGSIAKNFLRQVYTLFEEMNIRSTVNIRVVFFDTEILCERIITSREDAVQFIEEYKAMGFGGTDFECVFEYADSFSEMSPGKKLKGLFFFSDAFGSFPSEMPYYKTTFFVPYQDGAEEWDYDHVPEWVELVHYDDRKK